MTFDHDTEFVIIGSGSAGSTLANRLSADAVNRVLVLEAGPADRGLFSWMIHMPTAFAWPLRDDRFNWFYHSEPEPWLNDRVIHCPRGRVLGGSSSINGMVYIRGHALDYDKWAQRGCRGWSYRDVLPYFRRAETHEKGSDDYHGGDGPLHVTAGLLRSNPLHRAFTAAAVEKGYAESSDLNGFRQEGIGAMDRTTRNGRRWSTATAYLKPALRRANLSLATRALVTRILIENGQAVGVEYLHRNEVLQGSRHARGHSRGRRHQLAPDPAALRHRPRRPPCRSRHHASPRPAPGGRKPAGPPRGLCPARMQGTRQSAAPPDTPWQTEGRPRVVPHQVRAGNDQSHGVGWIHPQPRRHRTPRHPVSLPADGHDLRRLQCEPHARFPGNGRHHAAALAGTCQDPQRRSAPGAGEFSSTTSRNPGTCDASWTLSA